MLKKLMRDLSPPLIWRILSQNQSMLIRKYNGRRKMREWEYIPEGWAYAKTHREVKGWDVSDILEVYKSKWPKFVSMTEGSQPLGIAHESDLETNSNIYSHNTTMSFAYVLALAAHDLESLSMLDWGGGIGHYYLLAKALLPNVRIDYHCKEVPLLAEHGAQLFPEQYWYTDESCLERQYDLVMASTSMHYTEDWRTLLRSFAQATRRYLYVAHLPTVMEAPSFVFVQRPYAYGYNTEYLAWCLNQDEFINYAEQVGLTLIREFVYGYHPHIHNAPEQNEYRGYLFTAFNANQDRSI